MSAVCLCVCQVRVGARGLLAPPCAQALMHALLMGYVCTVVGPPTIHRFRYQISEQDLHYTPLSMTLSLNT